MKLAAAIVSVAAIPVNEDPSPEQLVAVTTHEFPSKSIVCFTSTDAEGTVLAIPIRSFVSSTVSASPDAKLAYYTGDFDYFLVFSLVIFPQNLKEKVVNLLLLSIYLSVDIM